MLLHEGELIGRTLIQHREGAGAAIRTLLDVQRWLGTLSGEEINRTVLYVTLRPDTDSEIIATDTYWLYVKTHGMRLAKAFASFLNNSSLQMAEHEFPLATIGTPLPVNNILLSGRFANWRATETHRVLIELQAYLLDKGPGEMLVRYY